MKMLLREQKLQTDDGLKLGVMNWLCSQDETFHAAGTINLSG
jgi:hypothetical protein